MKVAVSEEEKDYAAYLLRLRRSDQDGQPIWRAMLESTHDGQRMNFADVDALIVFLRARFDPMKKREDAEQRR